MGAYGLWGIFPAAKRQKAAGNSKPVDIISPIGEEFKYFRVIS